MHELRLLSVDDDRLMAGIICHIGQQAGFVTRACTGKTVKAAYDDFKPDVVVLEILIPEVDGIEVVRFLSNRWSVARIVIVSSGKSYRRMAESLGHGLSLAIEAAITKPFEGGALEKLLTRIRESLLHAGHYSGTTKRRANESRQIHAAPLKLPRTNSS